MRNAVDGLTPGFVANALDVPETGRAESDVFAGMTSDSRADVRDKLFVAIRGERFDGHDFIEQAVAGGASAILAERESIQGRRIDAPVFAVDDTVKAWRRIAGAWRRRFKLPIIAIGGSAGKTTTKDLLAAMLSGKFARVLATRGSRNGYLGLAMTLSELRAEHDVAVIEIGIDAPGAMLDHAALVNPDVALVTTVGAEHLDKLDDIETVAAEEAALLDWTAGAGGDIVINCADPWLRRRAWPVGRVFYYRLGGGASPALEGRADSGRLALDGMGFAGECLPLPLPGRHNALNLLAAAALARQSGLGADEMRAGLSKFRPDAARSNIERLASGARVLVDYYNASPMSVAAALETLAELHARARWVCLADMLELGPGELEFHRDLAMPIAAMDAAGVLLHGPRMKALAEALGEMRFQGEVIHSTDKTALGRALRDRLRAGDAVLIKGSRGMAMEKVMDELRDGRMPSCQR